MGLREDAPENKMNKPAVMVRKVGINIQSITFCQSLKFCNKNFLIEVEN
jgi:hypothetical protein